MDPEPSEVQSNMPKSVQLQTAETLVAAFNRMDITTIMAVRAPECMRHILPAALGQPSMNNTQYRLSLEKLKAIFHNFCLTVHDVSEDRDARKVIMYVRARADTLAGEYINEYMWTMWFDPSGLQIVNWTEFVDSVMNRDFFPKLQAAMNAMQATKDSSQPR